MMKILWLLLLFPLVASYAGESGQVSDEAVQQIEDATILSSTPRPPDSGILRTWVILEIATPTNQHLEIYIPYGSMDQDIPTVGSICSITARKELIYGVSANGTVDRNRPLLVPSEMKCGGKNIKGF